MKVTVDTRHDSLEEALATVHAAFGSNTTQSAPAVLATTPPAATGHIAKPARSRKAPGARPGTKKPPAKRAATKTVPASAPARAAEVSAGPASRTHVAAPSAESSRQPAPAKKVAKSLSKAAAVRKASRSKSAQKKAPAENAAAHNGTKSTRSMNPTSNIAPRGQADTIRAWAKQRGMDVKQAGRLPAAVIQAYQEWPTTD
jgi:DNA-binding protein HU-beta